MRKIISVLMMVLFLFSLAPAGLAEETGTIALAEEDTANAGQDDSAVQLREAVKNRNEALKQQRVKIKENLEQAKQDFREAQLIRAEAREEIQEKFKQAKEKFVAKRDALVEARKQFRNCEGEECADFGLQYRKNAKAYLERTSDVILKLLEKLKGRVLESSLEDKDNVASLIDEKISEVGAVKDNILSMGEEPTRDEIQDAAHQIKGIWIEAKRLVRVSAGRVVLDRYAGVLVKIEKLELKMDRIVSRMESEGLNITLIEPKLAEFREHLDAATSAFEEGKSMYSDAGIDSGELAEAKERLRSAKEHLKDAHTALKAIVAEIKKQTGGSLILVEEMAGE